MSSETDEPTTVEVKSVHDTSKETAVSKKPKAKKKKPNLTINLTNCKYDSVRRVARRFGLRPVGDDEEWTVYWIDTSIILDRVMSMKRYQKINHFPGMSEICRKDLLARNMNRMIKLFPKEYNIFPKSWCMPADYSDFKEYCRAHKHKTFITKPENSSQGKGIIVFKNPKEIRAGEHSVVQHYLARPFIIDGFKFDLRIYVVVTSCDPFRIYVYKDGLARFATVKYHEPTSANVAKQCMHLTNYAINKHSKDFVRDDDSGSKRRITTVNQWFVDNGYDLGKIWHDIDDVIIKTLIAAHHTLKHNYRSCFPNHNTGSACFEILGFDVLLDSKLKPWLIEVNHSPSFHTDAPLDKEVKEGLLFDTMNLIDLYANDKQKCEEEDRRRAQERLLQKSREPSASAEEDSKTKYEAYLETYEKTHKGGLRRIYPNGNEHSYTQFFNQSSSLCAETAASKMRVELSRQQRQEIEAKQREMEAYKQKLSGGKVKGEDLRPESPREVKKPCSSAGPAGIKRRATFRLPNYNRAGHRVKPEETPIVPCGEGVNPQTIRDEEELERLAGLQLRDSLVRGLGVSEQLQIVLDSDLTPSSTRVPSAFAKDSAPTMCTFSKPLFYIGHTYQLGSAHGLHHDSGIEEPSSAASLTSTEQYCYNSYLADSVSTLSTTTPVNSLPGSRYQLAQPTPKPPSCGYLKRYSGQSRSVQSSTASVNSLSAAYNRPACSHGNRPGAQVSVDKGAQNRRSHRLPSATLDLNAETFGLSVTSAPIRLAIRKQYPNPGMGGARGGIPQHPSNTTHSHHVEALTN